MTTIDISLNNTTLWSGCTITEVAGRKNCETKMADAVNIIGANIAKMGLKGDTAVLTGAAPVWAYLVVFHAVCHAFTNVIYNDGRGGEALVAKHSH